MHKSKEKLQSLKIKKVIQHWKCKQFTKHTINNKCLFKM